MDIKISADEAREFTESIINTVREPLIVLDHDLRVVTAGRSFYEFFKVKPEETVGMLIYDLGNKQWDIPKLRELLETILPEKATFDNYEVEHSFETIGRRTMILNARQIEREPGQERIILLAIEDITERKHLHEELKESEERFRRAFETSHDALLLIHKTKGDILNSNASAQELLKYSAEEFLKNGLWDIGMVKDFKDFQETVSRLEIDGIMHFKDTPVRNKEGRSIDTEVFLMDRAKVVQCNIRNITERKKYEHLLLQSDKMEAIGTLAAGIAHDFNNIMMGILGNISIVKVKLPKGHPLIKYLEDSELSVTRATHLTNQLLTFAKGGKPVKDDVKIENLIMEVSNFNLSGSNVKLDFEQHESLWTANIDEGQIQQVFSNLVINAKQAMSEGGVLHISVDNIDIPQDNEINLDKGRYIRTTIRDEGCGIDQKHQNRIFDPFFTTKKTGSGLGLAVVYSVIINHGGQISISSKINVGTTFTLYLPASKSQLIPKPKEPEDVESSKLLTTARILVMDDEAMICKIIKETLELNEFSVSTASGGKMALEMYKQSLVEEKPFDVVIMDLTIPGGMGGKEAIKEFLKINPNVKCIASSGYANDPIMADYREYGFKGVIIKPYMPKELLRVLSQVLEE